MFKSFQPCLDASGTLFCRGRSSPSRRILGERSTPNLCAVRLSERLSIKTLARCPSGALCVPSALVFPPLRPTPRLSSPAAKGWVRLCSRAPLLSPEGIVINRDSTRPTSSTFLEQLVVQAVRAVLQQFVAGLVRTAAFLDLLVDLVALICLTWT